MCSMPIEWDDPQCNTCYTEWSADYWIERWQKYAEDIYLDTPAPEPQDINDGISYLELAQEWEQYTLCCEQKLKDCKCELSIPGDSVFDIEPEAYSEQSLCVNCIWCMTAVCPELRNLAKIQAHAKAHGYTVTQAPIEGCTKFLLDEDSL